MGTNYILQFRSLKTAKIMGLEAPHKVILLLSIIDLIECGLITTNKIELTDKLEEMFKSTWSRYVGDSVIFQPKLATPFWHMSNEPFWRLISFSGEELTKDNFQGNKYSLINQRKQIQFAEIDQGLFDILSQENARASFRVLLIGTYLYNTHGNT